MRPQEVPSRWTQRLAKRDAAMEPRSVFHAGAKPDHYEVVVPNPADADTPLYENQNVDDCAGSRRA